MEEKKIRRKIENEFKLNKLIIYVYCQLVERSKFKKVGHPRKGRIPGLSPNGDSLVHCNRVLSCQKKNYICLFKTHFIYFSLIYKN